MRVGELPRERQRPPCERPDAALALHRLEQDRGGVGVDGVRGLGLLLAVELDRPAGPVVAAALERGLLVGTAGETALRLTPPLTITAAESDTAIEILREVIG